MEKGGGAGAGKTHPRQQQKKQHLLPRGVKGVKRQ